MDIATILLDVLEVVSDAITSMVGLLPNPDPFPGIIDAINVDTSDATTTAFFWLIQFVDLPAISAVLAAYFTMFAIAWIIMTIWKWVKAR